MTLKVRLHNSLLFRLCSTVSGNELRKVMQHVPKSVVVVTARDRLTQLSRGVTCSSFTSVSRNPPIISFCMQNPSRFHNLLTQCEKFAVNVLSETQVNMSIHFSTPVADDCNQFDQINHKIEPEHGLPLIDGSVAHILCSTKEYHEIGDHFVWFGSVMKTIKSPYKSTPLLFFGRSYHSIGDDIFITAFEDTTLPFDLWTHKAHLRMAWNYLKQYDLQTALCKVREGINRFNQKNADKIKFGYSETVTVFYLTMVDKALRSKSDVIESGGDSFEDFLDKNQQLVDKNLPFKFYSKSLFFSEAAKQNFVEPDLASFRPE